MKKFFFIPLLFIVSICFADLAEISDLPEEVDNKTLLYSDFNEGTGSTAYNLAVGTGADGVITGGAWVDGILGKAIDLDGVDDNVNYSSAGFNYNSDGFTVMTWIKTTDSVGAGQIFSNYSGGAGDLMQFKLNEKPGVANEPYAIRFNVTFAGIGNSSTWLYYTPLYDGEWHHIAAVYDPSVPTGIIYIDGVKPSQTVDLAWDSGGYSSSHINLIGAINTGSGQQNLDAAFDKAAILDRVVSAGEMYHIYTRKTGIYQ